jgi:UDP-N-acetylmuramate: L-alanyl-gamma-D-glutamyl-meso-diaminopimelate ligase
VNIYFLGIAGAGVSALASVLVSEGHTVIGSDEGVYPPVSTYLDRLGVKYFTRFDPANVPAQIDLAIVGASAKLKGADNPELTALKARGVPLYTFPEYLGLFTQNRENIVVAGSFGKSTLTALITHLLRTAGRDPGFFIGAIPLDLPVTGHAGTDATFVLEGDEYVISMQDRRSKFVLYHPAHTLISSLVHDHVNMFPTMADYVAPFAELVKLTPKDGLLVCARGHGPLDRITKGRDVIWYGLEPGPGYGAEDIEIGEITKFNLTLPLGGRVAIETELLGLHNIENIVGAAALLLELDLITLDALRAGARSFRGVARRLDKKTTTSRLPCFEGFGSSYEKARSAIEAVRLHFPQRPLVVVFEPHTFSWRNEDAKAWYDSVFEGASRVLMMPPPEHGAAGHAQMNQDEIVARVVRAGVNVDSVSNGADVLASLERTLNGEEVVLLLSSGPLDGLAESLPRWLDITFA